MTNVLSPKLPPNIEKWLDVELPEGRCVGVGVRNEDECFPNSENDHGEGETSTHDPFEERFDWMTTVYHPGEIQFAMSNLKKASRTSFWLGRLALRTALDFPSYPVLKDEYGRPKLMIHDDITMLGSISHKQHRGVALVASTETVHAASVFDDHDHLVLVGIGVDLEMTCRPGRLSIAKRILTPSERKALGRIKLPNVSTDEEEVLLRFSLKEAIYKAVHPILNQYVGFQEAEVTPHADGTATCIWMLQDSVTQPVESIAKLTAHWQRITLDGGGNENDGYDFFLTSASVYTAKSLQTHCNKIMQDGNATM
jgi:4'-phosphopantetheinyl transferase EntD